MLLAGGRCALPEAPRPSAERPSERRPWLQDGAASGGVGWGSAGKAQWRERGTPAFLAAHLGQQARAGQGGAPPSAPA